MVSELAKHENGVGSAQIDIENIELLSSADALAVKVNSARALDELKKLDLFPDVIYQPKLVVTDVAEWQQNTKLTDQWVDANPTKALMCCRPIEIGNYILLAMKDQGRLNPAELTSDDLREWGHEWTHPWQNTQMNQGGGKNLFVLTRGFIAEAACELIQRDLVGHGLPVTLENGLVPMSEIRQKGFFGIDSRGIGQNTAYFSAYLWLRKLITSADDRPASSNEVRQFLAHISQFGTTSELDDGIEARYPGYKASIE